MQISCAVSDFNLHQERERQVEFYLERSDQQVDLNSVQKARCFTKVDLYFRISETTIVHKRFQSFPYICYMMLKATSLGML